jgi:1-acyl-sn-glycerol-3-phosphate acyltransferase
MNLSKGFILSLFRGVTGAIFRIHAAELAGVPACGPLILATNHVNILEIPLIYSCLQPRDLHGLVLSTRWKNPVVAWGLDVCGTIPLERGGINLEAMRRALDVLKAGGMLIISPEGTRSGDGVLQNGQPGIVPLALKSGAPILPIGYYGGEGYRQNLKRLRRTDFHFGVGRPFRLAAPPEGLTRDARARMVDEIMYQLAAILPAPYRGRYAALEQATSQFLQF